MDGCPNPDAENVLCINCWGLIELNCGCPIPRANFCTCANQARSDEFTAMTASETDTREGRGNEP